MKENLREKYLKIRKNITSKEILDASIFKKVINNEKVKDASLILVYVSKKEEVDTYALINYFLKRKKVAVPKVIGENIEFYYINNTSQLSLGSFNVMEPISSEKVTAFKDAVCLVPGVCFNKEGYRIGYGKGFYDRFLNNNKVYSIGLCYQKCLINEKFNSKYDEKVNEIIAA